MVKNINTQNGFLKAQLLELVLLYGKIKFTNEDGMTHCCTCGTYAHRSFFQGGHFIPQSKGLSTKFELDNVNCQCAGCNGRANQGEQYLHGIYIDRIYGQGRAYELRKQGNKSRQRKDWQLIEEIERVANLIITKYNTRTKRNKTIFLEYIQKPHRKKLCADLFRNIKKNDHTTK